MLCLIQAPCTSQSGYGAHSRDIVRSIISKYPDWDIKIADTRWGSTPRDALKKGDDDIILNKFLTTQLYRQPDLYIQITVPNEFRKVGKYNIGITAGIETTKCAPEWLQGCNEMDLVITTSEHSKSVFEQTEYGIRNKQTGQDIGTLNLKTPIEILFEGVDKNIYHKSKESYPIIDKQMDKIPEKYAFLFVGHWIKGNLGHDRKDVGMLIKTFCETFKGKSNKPALILKSSGAGYSILDREEILKKINQIRTDDSLPNVYLLHGSITNEEMNGLYNHPKVKTMVSFTHGEGYGRPLAEFATSEKPIIATNWSGHIDFLDNKYSTLLPGELKQVDGSVVQDKIIIPDSKWFYVNYFYASQAMKDVFENYKNYLDRAKKQADIINDKFTKEQMDDKLFEIFEKNLPEFPKEMKIKLPKLKKLKRPTIINKEEK
jgi:hypothetical protein